MGADRSSKKYVRSFLFSMKLGTPVERLHVITKLVMIFVLSAVSIYMFDLPLSRGGPDLVGLVMLLAAVVALLALAGTTRYLFSSYLVMAIPVLVGEFLWWLLFNPALPGPKLVFLGFTVSLTSVYVAASKALGYAVMIYSVFLFLLTTRDSEIMGALLKLGLKFKQAFFVSLTLRNLNTIMGDYENIRMAQEARSGTARKGILGKVIDLGYTSVPLIASMIRRSTEMGIALQARGFEESSSVTDFKETRPFSAADYAVLALLTVLSVYTVLMGHTLTALLGVHLL
ncbi:MAG: energy-coupling factor transporter transmembrane component T family protein [Thermoprotei archaeon]